MNTRTCTWVGCSAPAVYLRCDKTDQPWADLCDAHNAELERALSAENAKLLLSGWVKAQGGAKRAAERMKGL